MDIRNVREAESVQGRAGPLEFLKLRLAFLYPTDGINVPKVPKADAGL
jgi:hypothetical protein